MAIVPFNKINTKEYPNSFTFGGQNYLMLVKPRSEQGGFDFIVLRFVSCSIDSPKPFYLKDQEIRDWNDTTECEEFCLGIAYHDGLRHLYFEGEDDDGYLYYPNPRIISEIFLKIRELEELFCSTHDDNLFSRYRRNSGA